MGSFLLRCIRMWITGHTKKKGGVCLSQWAKSILLKQMVGRVWDFNHRNKARNLPFFRSAHYTRARAERDGAGRVIGKLQLANKKYTAVFHTMQKGKQGRQSNDPDHRDARHWKKCSCTNSISWVRPYREWLYIFIMSIKVHCRTWK